MKKEFKKSKKTDREPNLEFKLGDIPFMGGLLKGIEKLVDLAERVKEAGGEIKKTGEIKGEKGKLKGIYGFSIRTGIGEAPKIQTFGNIRAAESREKKKPGLKIAETREPIIDVFDEGDHIRVVAELPGVDEDTITLELKGDILILEAGDEKRKYSKEILLPCPTSHGRPARPAFGNLRAGGSPGGRAAKVNFEIKEKNFKNGVLEIKIKMPAGGGPPLAEKNISPVRGQKIF